MADIGLEHEDSYELINAEDGQESADDECEEDSILNALIDEFSTRNGRDPTKEEVDSWMTVLKEANEEKMIANFGKSGREATE
jgi:hypothetical protein